MSGPPGRLVAPEPPADGRRLAVLANPGGPALVLGSAQPDMLADRRRCEAGGWEVVRRRSGGGAVVVAPGAQVWLDVFVPAADPRFDADVVRAAAWLGEAWAAALGAAGLDGPLEVHAGRLASGPFGRLACFAGLGPGEVRWKGRKVVGLSQRRSRAGAYLHTMALVEDRHGEVGELLALPAATRSGLAAALAGSAAAVPVGAAELEAALAAELGRR